MSAADRRKLQVAVKAQEGYYVENQALKRKLRNLEEQLETLRQERDDERRRAINAETRLIALQRGKL